MAGPHPQGLGLPLVLQVEPGSGKARARVSAALQAREMESLSRPHGCLCVSAMRRHRRHLACVQVGWHLTELNRQEEEGPAPVSLSVPSVPRRVVHVWSLQRALGSISSSGSVGSEMRLCRAVMTRSHSVLCLRGDWAVSLPAPGPTPAPAPASLSLIDTPLQVYSTQKERSPFRTLETVSVCY